MRFSFYRWTARAFLGGYTCRTTALLSMVGQATNALKAISVLRFSSPLRTIVQAPFVDRKNPKIRAQMKAQRPKLSVFRAIFKAQRPIKMTKKEALKALILEYLKAQEGIFYQP